MAIHQLKITPEDFAEFLKMLLNGDVNSANGQKLLSLMIETGTDPSHLLEEHHLGQNMDEEELRKTVQRHIDENPKQVEDFKNGKEAVLMWFVGGVMKATEGRANPEKVKALVKELTS